MRSRVFISEQWLKGKKLNLWSWIFLHAELGSMTQMLSWQEIELSANAFGKISISAPCLMQLQYYQIDFTWCKWEFSHKADGMHYSQISQK